MFAAMTAVWGWLWTQTDYRFEFLFRKYHCTAPSAVFSLIFAEQSFIIIITSLGQGGQVPIHVATLTIVMFRTYGRTDHSYRSSFGWDLGMFFKWIGCHLRLIKVAVCVILSCSYALNVSSESAKEDICNDIRNRKTFGCIIIIINPLTARLLGHHRWLCYQFSPFFPVLLFLCPPCLLPLFTVPCLASSHLHPS